MKATVDKDLCSACGICVEVCPEVFEMGDDDRAWAKVDPVPSDVEGSCREAADGCPESAIEIEENSLTRNESPKPG